MNGLPERAAHLVIWRDGRVERTVRLEPETGLFTLGSLPECDVCLEDEGNLVSRMHAAVVRLGQGAPQPERPRHFLRDLGSLNGTLLNGLYVHKVALKEGDKIQVGPYTLRYYDRRDPADLPQGMFLEQLVDSLSSARLGMTRRASAAAPVSGAQTGQQEELLRTLLRVRIDPLRPDDLHDFMTALLGVLRAEQAFVGFWEGETLRVAFQQGFDREILRTSREFCEECSADGPVIIKGAAIWYPLPGKGIMALIRKVTPPFMDDDLAFLNLLFQALQVEADRSAALPDRAPWPETLVGLAQLQGDLLRIARAPGRGTADCLLRGRTGAGKEAVARFIHERSERGRGPFETLNCRAVPDSLIGDELFGHEKGAHSEAKQTKKGIFELAEGGVVFLDEIGDLPEAQQVALLTAMQQREIRRLGGGKQIKMNVRIIAATDQDVETRIMDGTFREALCQRFTYRLTIPELRERPQDIPLLAHYFLDKYADSIRVLSREALELLRNYHWPGNVRELEKVIEAMVARSRCEILFSWDLPERIRGDTVPPPSPFGGSRNLKDVERQTIVTVLEEVRGDRTRAADILGIARSTLYEKIDKHGLDDCGKPQKDS